MKIMKISIVVATYNGEKYLKEQLDSFINQTILPNEIVISDDGSNDATLQIIRDFSRKCKCYVKLLYNNSFHGVTGNFENAAKYASGDLVFFSDQDDVWYPNKIEETLEAFKKYPDCVGVFSDADCVDINLNKLGVTFNDGCWKKFKLLPYDEDNMYRLQGNNMMSEVVKGNILGGCCLAIKNYYLKKMFNFCPSIFHDDWLCYCMFTLGDVVALNKSLFAYRLHGNNTVGFNTVISNNQSFRVKIKKLLRRLKNLNKLFIDNAERAIYFKNFADRYNVNCPQVDYQWELNKKRINAITSKKINGLKKLKKIALEVNQFKTTNYYFECLYVVVYSKNRRKNDMKEYIKIFNL